MQKLDLFFVKQDSNCQVSVADYRRQSSALRKMESMFLFLPPLVSGIHLIKSKLFRRFEGSVALAAAIESGSAASRAYALIMCMSRSTTRLE